MFSLRRLLPDDAKARRHAGNLLNIHVTFLAWLTEVFGFLFIFLGTFVLGHENKIVTFSMQTVTLIITFNILPCVYLINEMHFKTKILNSKWYITFLNILNWQYKKQNYEEESNAAAVDNQIKEEDKDVHVDSPGNVDDDKKDGKRNTTEQNKKTIILRNNFVDSSENQNIRKCEIPKNTT